MRRIAVTASAIALVSVISGCQQMRVVEDAVDKACKEVMPLARIAAFVPGIPASISAYAIAACDTVAGLAKLRADPTSVAWLAKLRDDLKRLGF